MTIGVAIIGTGFIGSVHLAAVRRLGLDVRGVLGSSADRGAARAAELGVGRAYADLDELVADGSASVVHVTSPNNAHFPQVKALLQAGKHVICEKPLAVTAAQSAELAEIARTSDCVAAVCYNIRFYPLNQHAHRLVADGELGDIRFVTGHYHQDWLAKPTDWNWRLEADKGGALRSVGDIGTHWLDLTTFITGLKPVHVLADLATFIPEREKPGGPVETFSSSAGQTEKVRVDTDDAAAILIRYDTGARGVMSTSQINVGRKNELVWDIAGSCGSAAWHSETPDHLWLGRRDGPNEVLHRDFTLMNDTGIAAATLPPGHVEGFADSFFALFRQVYRDISEGGRQADSTWATFEDGHLEMQFCDAVLKSMQEGRWVEIREA
ncbi:MAG: Gfo/Idh/MocA family oxidoreductase [Boseongicola sp. SB0662_bin_57]|nr:Gfo/Idh/MocA family oxidoreductase [Boseongicola sp. SB0662_bin_57]